MRSYFKKSIFLLPFIFLFASSFQLVAQEGTWETYLKKIDNYLMEVTVDMDLYFERPFSYKNLVIIASETKHCYKNGFPKPTGLEEFYTFSDSIALKIQKHTKNKLAGIITYKCTGFDIYYVRDTTSLRSEINTIFEKDFSNKQTYLTIRPDKKWFYFSKKLVPTNLSNEFFVNHEYLTELAQGGDALDTPRKINHWFYFNNIKRRGKFIEKAKVFNYAIDSVVYNKEKRYPYQVLLSKKDSVHPSRISEITAQLLLLSKKYYGKYDGWEMESIEKEEN